MKKFLLDTNAAGDLLARREPFLARLKQTKAQGHRIGLCEPVVAELYFGIERSRSKTENLIILESMLRRFPVWPFDRSASKKYGEIAAQLRATGKPIQQIDMMIASIALSLDDCVLITSDSDFQFVPKLRCENWRY